MHPLSEGDRLRVRDELLTWAGVSGSARETHRSLDAEEIVELRRGGLIDVGCHTVTHPQLSSLSLASQRDEINQSKHRLEEIVGHPVTSFAYPYGRDCDYTPETIALIREAGFDCACINSTGIVERNVNRFELPRVHTPDIDGDAFARLLLEWLSP
jgi:peptidoglycan/xylan/chitin deacetylase (PgdA/CDA1 family)